MLDQAARVPDRAALIAGGDGQAISYAALAHRIDSVAAGLARRGIAHGDVIAIWAPNVPPWAGVSLAALRLGAAVTGIHPAATVDEARGQLATSRAVALVTLPSMAAAAGAAAEGTAVRHVIPITAGLVAEPGAPARHSGPADLALLPFSSGTTGLPKGVMLTHSNVTAATRQLAHALGLGERDTVLALAPFAHVMGFVVTLAAPLSAGAGVVTMPRFDFVQLLELVERHGITVVVLPPPVMTLLARHPALDAHELGSVELIVSGGAPLSAALHEEVAARFPGAAVGQGYGLTETAVGIAGPVRRTGTLPGSVGRPLPGTELRLVDPETGADAGAGPGELWARGPQVMSGYLDAPEATTDTITTDGWLRSGDVARVDADGNVFVVDRLKELIKVNALQVAPAELEALLMTHPHVADAAVVACPDARSGEVPVAVVVPDGELDADALIVWAAERVAPHKRIRAVLFTESIPRTPAGKILRRRLSALVEPVGEGAM